MVDFVAYSGLSDAGWTDMKNEDYVKTDDLNLGDDLFFAAIGDGTGSKKDSFDPAGIAIEQTDTVLKRYFQKDKALLKNHARTILEMAVMSANDTLVAFRLGDESNRSGYAAAMTCALVTRDGLLVGAHAGNTRLYLLRDQNTIQLTKDHTRAQRMVDRGEMDPGRYYRSIEKLDLYNGVGISPEPEIQTFQISLKKSDIVLMTSDGVHFSGPDDQFLSLIIESKNLDDAVRKIIDTSKELKLMNDNMSAILFMYTGTTK